MAKKPKPRKTRIDAVPDEKIAEALRLCNGRQMHAADLVKLDGGTVCARIQKSPYLQQVVRECRVRFCDDAEAVLARLHKVDNFQSAAFVLRNLGKDRGYDESSQIVVPADLMSGLDSIKAEIKSYSLRKALQSKDKTAAKSE
jgi:hypothetical protein